jgi:glycosyltransferase involved in cell wall biosynthesis
MKKSIAILGTRGIPARYGGFETFAEELALRLARQGVDVTVYCVKGAGESPPSYHGVRLVYIPSFSCGPFTTILFDLLCLWDARKRHDVIYMLGYGAAHFCLIPRLWGSKIWLNVDGIEWARAKWSATAKFYFKAMEWFSTWVPDLIIADANGIKTHLENRHRCLSCCTVIPYGAEVVETPPDTGLLSQWDLLPQEFYLVVSRIEPENHVREIVEGYKISKSTIPLVVVGNHKSGTAYADSLLLLADDNVRFIGGVYEKEKLQALRYHSLAYFHGHSVGGTNPSLLEALGCGNLIVAHDNVFNREVTGEIGFYFKVPEDIPSLVGKIERLSIEERQSLTCKAKSRIRENYDWDEISNFYHQILTDV